eukprot:TRINITY_DN1456_c0_g1_i3.p1 TRINITY_DN1456_c0_g1~~TRINITY_DN1456_c0_g1_i3.p1  ORF type:complete len:936 (-),score=158.70 TRINITY_DN1456_c0_g1_i3:822-3629(-)
MAHSSPAASGMEVELRRFFKEATAALLQDVPIHIKVQFQEKMIVYCRTWDPELAFRIFPPELKSGIRCMCTNSNRKIRTNSLRLIRYLMCDLNVAKQFLDLSTEIGICRALEKDKTNEQERLQALKLVRRMMEIDCKLISRAVIQSLISIAEHPDDNFRRVCLETLCEITVRNPGVVAYCNGLRTIFNAVLDPAGQEIIDSLVLTILYILNDENTRCFVRPQLELEVILAPFTEPFFQEGPDRDARLNASRIAVITMMKSWTGIICLSSDQHGLRTIVEALRLPSKETKKVVLSTIAEIFRFPSSVQIRASQSVNHGNSKEHNMYMSPSDIPPRTRNRHNLMNNYIAAILIAFVNCGLLESLIELGKGADKQLSSRASNLLGEILYVANNLLPPTHCAKLQSLPTLVNHAAFFKDLSDRSMRCRANNMLTSLHSYLRNKKGSMDSYTDIHLALLVTSANKWKRAKGADLQKDRIDDLKLKMDSMMDDTQFQHFVKESMVPEVKDHTKWNWDIISDILEGNLAQQPSRMAICLKSKFFKRICSFFKPEKKQFIVLPYNTENAKYVRIMCELIEVLLSNDEGVEFLRSNELLPQITSILRAEVENISETSIQRPLKKERLAKSMAREYFTLIGVLSSDPKGLELMQRARLWSYLYPILDLPSREDLAKLVITSLDYNREGTHARILLSKAMKSPSKDIRQEATNHIKLLWRAGVSDFAKWGIELLVTQVYDPDHEVAQAALMVLDEACDELDCLDCLISKRPNFHHMGQPGKNLMLRLLSTPSGFRYLYEVNALAPEFSYWRETGNIAYVNNIEIALANSMNLSLESENPVNPTAIIAPPHFYGELAKTRDGCEEIHKSGVIIEFVELIKSHEAPSIQRRAALWAVGHIGSSSLGYQLLEPHGVLPLIIELAEESACLSLRGSVFGQRIAHLFYECP